PAPSVLSLTAEGINKDDIITGQIDSLLIPFPGAFSGSPASGLKETILLKTTKNAQLVDGFMAQLSGEQIEKEFKSAGQEYPLAVRLTGKFKTAFPNGKPKEKADEKPDADGKKDTPKPKPENSLKESSAENVVLLIGDADLLNDAVSVEIQQFFNQRIVIPRNGNLTFVQSAVEQLAGDSNLISVRSRATLNRPFTRVKKMETQAQETFQSQIHEMQTSLAETQRRLSELQQNKEKGQKFIMSPEQQKELEKFRKKESETNKKLKQLQKNLRAKINSLENRLKWLNILAMPALVALSGIVLAIFKHRRATAK
ncbi:MAG: hypothetical protein M3Y82_00670, partial [Verrucomicrobiota bacterium]|nr:hypothetical protein [Verrucomicrobiota bacterium]